MIRSSTKELFTPFKEPEREFRSSRKLLKILSFEESRSPKFNLFSDLEEYSKEEVAETMAETIERYMSKTRADYGSGITRPKIDDKDSLELKGQFLKELHDNTFSGSDHEDANEHIKKVFKIVDLFYIPNLTQDQVMLRAFPVSLTKATSRWLRNKPSGSITTWEDLKTKFLSKYFPPARTAKKMEEINNYQDAGGKTFEEAYYTQFGGPFQGGGYRAAALGFYQRNNANPSYQERRQSMEETLIKFMSESAKRHEENSNMIKEIGASTDAVIRNQGASIKTLEIQIGKISKVLQERGFRSLPSSTKANLRDHVKSISTTAKSDSNPMRRIGSSQYAASTPHNKRLMFKSRQTTILFPSHLNDYYYEEKKGSYGSQFLEAYSYGASHVNNSIPRKEKDLGSFTLPCYINNVCFENAFADLGASISVMPLSTYLNLGLGELAHIKLIVELADKTVKYPKGIAENVLVVENMDGYLDQDMGDIILEEPFCKASCIEARRFDGLITIHNGSDNVTYQMARSHPRRDEKKRLDHLKQDLRMLVIKRFRERKNIFEERKYSENFVLRVIMEYLVKIRKKKRILELKQRNMKITDPDIQYAVSIKGDTAYLERVVDFEDVPNRDRGMVERNFEGGRPSRLGADNNRSQGMNLPPLLAAYLGRSKNGQPLQSSLTSVHGGPQPSINTEGDLPPNDDTLQILGLYEDQHISRFVHRLRTRNLVEFLSTDLSTTYKGLMEKTYTWIKARDVATNKAPNDRRGGGIDRSRKNPSSDNNKGHINRDRFSPYYGSNHGMLSNLSKSPREIMATKRSQKPLNKLLAYPEVSNHGTCLSELKKGNKYTAPFKAPILMISRDNRTPKRKSVEDSVNEPSIKSLRIDSKTPLVGFFGEHSWPLGEVPLENTIGDSPYAKTEILNFVTVRSNLLHNLLLGRTTMHRMGIIVSTIHGTIKFHTPRGIGIVFSTCKSEKAKEEQKKLKDSKGYPQQRGRQREDRCQQKISRANNHYRKTAADQLQDETTRSPKGQRRCLCVDLRSHNMNSENRDGGRKTF
ncbi:hypothetical protein Tco_0526677 [Tanacetum coccineum]